MQLDSTNECKAGSRILILSSKWMIWYNYSPDAALTADQSLSGIWSYRSTRNKFAIKLSPLLQSLKINCYSETAEGLPTVQAKMNVAHSRTRHVFVMGSRGKEVSWKQQQSLEESVMLLPVVLENCISLPSLPSLCIPQSFLGCTTYISRGFVNRGHFPLPRRWVVTHGYFAIYAKNKTWEVIS